MKTFPTLYLSCVSCRASVFVCYVYMSLLYVFIRRIYLNHNVISCFLLETGIINQDFMFGSNDTLIVGGGGYVHVYTSPLAPLSLLSHSCLFFYYSVLDIIGTAMLSVWKKICWVVRRIAQPHLKTLV